MGKQTINMLIADWVAANEPNAVEKLALKASESGVSVSASCVRMARSGHIPRPARRKALAEAMGVPESVLFPPAAGQKKPA